jgi:hypothetical protein
MIKLIIGFILGVLAAYYTLPVIENYFGKLPRPSWASGNNEAQHSSNIINSMPPSQRKTPEVHDFSNEIMAAITLSKTHNLDAKASNFSLKIISKLIEANPELKPFVRARIPDGLTNREALEIFEQLYALEG